MYRTSQAPRPLLPWANPYDMEQASGGNTIDWSLVSAYFFLIGRFTVKLNGAVLAGATSITVDALPQPLKAGTALDFGAAAVVVDADADAGDTTVTTTEFSDGVADNAEAYAAYPDRGLGRMIPAGTVMCRTSAGLLLPRRDAPGAEEAVGLIVSDAHENSVSDSKSGYGLVIKAEVYENLLPDADPATGDITAGWKTELQANSLGFLFRDWEDSRVS